MLPKLKEMISSYRAAVETARTQAGMSSMQAAKSVITARLAYGIGPRFHSLFELYRQPEECWRDFLLDEPLKIVLRKVNPAKSREIVNDKLLFAAHCRENNLPVIQIVCAIDRSACRGILASCLVQDLEDWCRRVNSGPDELFFKLIDGSWGASVFVAERREGGGWAYGEREGDSASLYAFAMDRLASERGWIVQPRVRPHATLQAIMSPHGLGTFRVVTAVRHGEAQILFAVLKIPVGKNRADNFFHGKSGNLIAAVELETGKLSRARASESRSWPLFVDVDFHPETGNRITGLLVPYWEELKRLVVQAHETLPGLATLGWDVALTEAGPVLVEANGTYDVDILQVAFKKGVRPDLSFLFAG